MKSNILKVFLVATLLMTLVILGTASSFAGLTTDDEMRTYYYVGTLNGHVYFYDAYLGFKYAAQKFNVEIRKVGPDGFDPRAQAEAFEQVLAKNPAGIVTPMYDSSCKPAIETAMNHGIPVIIMEAELPGHGALSYVGLDNYKCGEETAEELIRIAGDSGRVVLQGNWGASNTDAKVKGVVDYLTANSDWEIIGRVNDNANTEDSIKASKSAFNNYEDIDAILGLDSSSGPGIGGAMEELNIGPDEITVVCHDREDTTLEYIQSGHIDSTLINKTATEAYLAIMMLEAYNDSAVGLNNVPISRDNEKAGVNPIPDKMYTGTIIINKDNVEEFIHANMSDYETELFK